MLLHSGVTDRRGWCSVAPELSRQASVVAYDRRGFGETRPGTESFSHLADLLALLDYLHVDRAWLVGSSVGGKLALDAALAAHDRVLGLVLLAPAVSGAPVPERESVEPQLLWLDEQIDEQVDLGNLDEANRFETWLWLDGPNGPEGRVSGAVRELALEMNRVALANDAPEDDGHEVNAWDRLEEVAVPTTVACGSLDAGYLIARSEALAARIPNATYRCLDGMAHLPYLEDPSTVARIVIDALAEGAPLPQP